VVAAAVASSFFGVPLSVVLGHNELPLFCVEAVSYIRSSGSLRGWVWTMKAFCAVAESGR
jgi:hypothetical protein